MSTVISAEVTDDINEWIERQQKEGESKSAVIRRLLRDKMNEGPETGVFATVITFTIAFLYLYYTDASQSLFIVETATFHLFAVLWVSQSQTRRVVNLLAKLYTQRRAES